MIQKKHFPYNRSYSRILALQYLYREEFLISNDKLKINLEQAAIILDELIIDGFKSDISNYNNLDIKYANEILTGVQTEKNEIDSLIQNYAPSFPLKQVAIIDKSILRICIYEIKFNELNPSIAMDEAIEIAKVFGSDKSAAFINGVIDSLVQNDKI
ncbi:MAG: transcription antitermination factor NusB [SAR202 cluster bacterium]|uniref:NusB/RsmB/TIM44 domain-containing protein n=1 Tax=marine metagenome TaxID=408172 RepID=A0A382CK45_9ZZZZ|nr:transcription antitermination factor NusB [SAR202 cluster bacterium]|tara:strand:+ start:758 stop:1228 length:471 start_codon:yes stop_codon:yes gene_type:complete